MRRGGGGIRILRCGVSVRSLRFFVLRLHDRISKIGQGAAIVIARFAGFLRGEQMLNAECRMPNATSGWEPSVGPGLMSRVLVI